MSKTLLIDYTPFEITPQMITESEQQNNGRVIVTGVLQIAERRALGELDHPESSVVNLSNASHNVLDVWWKGDDVVGKVEVLSTPSGNILKELLKSGIKLGISSRGLGSVKQVNEDTVAVQDDFELVCWDFVSNPSTHGAFMKPAGMNESITSKKTLNKYYKVNNIINEMLCDLTCKCSLPS